MYKTITAKYKLNTPKATIMQVSPLKPFDEDYATDRMDVILFISLWVQPCVSVNISAEQALPQR